MKKVKESLWESFYLWWKKKRILPQPFNAKNLLGDSDRKHFAHGGGFRFQLKFK